MACLSRKFGGYRFSLFPPRAQGIGGFAVYVRAPAPATVAVVELGVPLPGLSTQPRQLSAESKNQPRPLSSMRSAAVAGGMAHFSGVRDHPSTRSPRSGPPPAPLPGTTRVWNARSEWSERPKSRRPAALWLRPGSRRNVPELVIKCRGGGGRGPPASLMRDGP